MSASFRNGTLTTFLHHLLTGPTLVGEFVDMLPQRARDRLRSDFLPDPREAEIAQDCKRRRAIAQGYREAQR